jgi:hypothetical protein
MPVRFFLWLLSERGERTLPYIAMAIALLLVVMGGIYAFSLARHLWQLM